MFSSRLTCGKVLEIGMDATCEYNLELYSVMAEYDNAGFPLTYCLLSTATAIDHQKRMKALVAWTKCLRDKFGINPIFAHVDKDMAEIGCLRQVRLAKAKLSTTPYNAKRAHAEFSFVDEDFIPPGTRVPITKEVRPRTQIWF